MMSHGFINVGPAFTNFNLVLVNEGPGVLMVGPSFMRSWIFWVLGPGAGCTNCQSNVHVNLVLLLKTKRLRVKTANDRVDSLGSSDKLHHQPLLHPHCKQLRLTLF